MHNKDSRKTSKPDPMQSIAKTYENYKEFLRLGTAFCVDWRKISEPDPVRRIAETAHNSI